MVRALSEAIEYVGQGNHDPHMAHARIKGMYNWANVASRTEIVYKAAMESEMLSHWDRITRHVIIPQSSGYVH